MSEIKQAVRTVRQSRNNDQLATARMHQTYIGGHLKEGAELPEVWQFLPHPTEWLHFMTERTLNISKGCAIDVLSNFADLDGEMQGLIEPYLQEIEMIVQG